MSEIASYTTTINLSQAQVQTISGQIIDGQYRMNILIRALSIVAEDHSGRLTSDIKNADGKTIACLAGIVTPKVPYGVAVQADSSGLVSFVYETKGDHQGFGKKLAGEISANYNAIALQMALSQMNLAPVMEVGRQRDGKRTILITGRI